MKYLGMLLAFLFVMNVGAAIDVNDSLVIRAILDSNGLTSVSVFEIVDTTSDIDTATKKIKNLQIKGTYTNTINTIPSEIENLTELKELDIWKTDLTSIPAHIGNITSLEILKIRNHPNLTELPGELGNLTNLSQLLIFQNGLISLPAELGNLLNLDTLDANFNKIEFIPNGLGNLSSLTRLNLSSNNLNSLPLDFIQLSAVTYLNLNGNKICGVTDQGLLNWLSAKNSEWFDGQWCATSEDISAVHAILAANGLDTVISQMSPKPKTKDNRISTLSLSFKNLTTMPDNIGVLTGLTELSISKNKLTSLPEALGNCVNLKTLRIDKNDLSSLPAGILNMDSLTTLALDSNKLCGLSPEMNAFISGLDSTWEYDQACALNANDSIAIQTILDANGKSTMSPSSIVKTKYLDQAFEIYAPEKNFASFNIPAIVGLEKLEEIWLMDNSITTFPTGLEQLPTLKILNLDRNSISGIPESVGQLTTLTKLGLADNGFIGLPESIVNLTSLEGLGLNGNDVCDVSPTIDAFIRSFSPDWRAESGCPAGVIFFKNQAVTSYGLSLRHNTKTSMLVNLALPSAQNINLSVFDIKGRLITSLMNGHAAAGTHGISWETNGLGAGSYLIKCVGDSWKKSQSFTLMK